MPDFALAGVFLALLRRQVFGPMSLLLGLVGPLIAL